MDTQDCRQQVAVRTVETPLATPATTPETTPAETPCRTSCRSTCGNAPVQIGVETLTETFANKKVPSDGASYY